MIDVQELTKRYGDKTAVDRLSFTVKPGHVTGFLGPNGAGKPVTELRLSLPPGRGCSTGRRSASASAAVRRTPKTACLQIYRHRSPPVRRPAAAVRYGHDVA